MTRNALPGDPSDTQSRYIEAAVNGVLVGCLYAPNGNPQPGPKFDYKLAWMERLSAPRRRACCKASACRSCWPATTTSCRPTSTSTAPSPTRTTRCCSRKPRALFRRLLEQGWTDAVRTLHPDEPMYTFWDYMRNRWPRDAGLRLDFLLLSPELAKRLDEAGVDRAVRGKPNASDHAPVWAMRRLQGASAVARSAQAPRRKTRAKPRSAVRCW